MVSIFVFNILGDAAMFYTIQTPPGLGLVLHPHTATAGQENHK